MNNPLVTVVMCTYNTETYIKKAIDSVLAQTFTDFEFIVWDDGSTDNTKEIVKSYSDNRIRYFYHENTGLGMALKLACAEAKGKYIARMDSDDICFPDRFAVEVDFLEKHPNHVLVSSAVYYIDENGNHIGRSFPCNADSVLKKILPISNMIVHPMVMMRRNAYERAGGYIPLKKCEDRVFWSRMSRLGKFYNIVTPLGQYRILQNSLSHSENPYNNVLYELRRKMILDDVIQESDVEWHNNLVEYSKPFTKKSHQEEMSRKETADERLFKIICIILGKEVSEKLIVSLKNWYYRRKLHV